MTSVRAVVTAVVLVGLLVCAACSSGADDPSPGAVFPPRPRDVDVARLDPCRLFGPGTMAALDLRNATPATFPVGGRPSPGCTWITDTDLNYNAQTIPGAAGTALSDPTASVVRVSGFGAVRSTAAVAGADTRLCQVVVDAAPDHVIRFQVLDTPGGRPYPDEELCRLAVDAASIAMASLGGVPG